MCNRGTWDGFAVTRIRGRHVIIEECSECGEYRGYRAEDIPVVNIGTGGEQATVEDDDSPWS